MVITLFLILKTGTQNWTPYKPIQPEKQDFPKEVTEEEMVIEVKPLQSLKHSTPNEVTEEGMVMEVKTPQP